MLTINYRLFSIVHSWFSLSSSIIKASRRCAAATLAIAAAVLLAACAQPASAQPIMLSATFDTLQEGNQGPTVSESGITLGNLLMRQPGGTEPGLWVAETADASVGTAFTQPNFLTAGVHIPGSGYSFGRFGSADISFGGVGDQAQVDVFGFGTQSPNTLSLQALLGGSVVASDSVDFLSASSSEVLQRRLSISGVSFDSLKLLGAGPDDMGVVFVGLDNLSITLVPEPRSALVIGAGLFALLVFGNRFSCLRSRRM